MKACLNASARDAQLRDSFNKESAASVINDSAFNFCSMLFSLQSELPRNASKLHSLVVVNSNGKELFVLNFEVLRSVTLTDNFMKLEFPIDDLTSKVINGKKNSKSQVKSENNNDGGESND